MNSRSLIKLCLALSICVTAAARTEPPDAATHAPPNPGDQDFSLRLPEDAGAHPNARTEWWYLTGWLDDAGTPVGFQITFFRSSLGTDPANPSGFNTRDAIFAHAALSDPRLGHILFAQRSMRAVFGLAGARTSEMDVHLKDWALRTQGDFEHMQTRIDDAQFSMRLELSTSGPVLLEGPNGVSRKGASSSSAKMTPDQAVSAYYSLPHLRVEGSVTINGRARPVTGSAWFDHEWSNQYLESDAQGWDWIGANLNDGSALMAFRMRKTDGSTLYSAATRRTSDGTVRYFGPDSVAFESIASWKSRASGVTYPVYQNVTVGNERFQLKPLFDDQEIDARNSTGTLYWEGATRLLDGNTPGIELGQGYLEMTGYGARLRLK